MWIFLPLAAAAGVGLYELLRPAPLSEVIGTSIVAVDKTGDWVIRTATDELDKAGIAYQHYTSGDKQWLQVKQKDYAEASRYVPRRPIIG